ncbi:MAG: hypothetical protein WC291_06870 [Thermodesulfovibrionales bacterium]|jgi:hypothetical protein
MADDRRTLFGKIALDWAKWFAVVGFALGLWGKLTWEAGIALGIFVIVLFVLGFILLAEKGDESQR